ncbi:hypothetical protein D3C83_178570 [compost metagenome]
MPEDQRIGPLIALLLQRGQLLPGFGERLVRHGRFPMRHQRFAPTQEDVFFRRSLARGRSG